VPPCNLKPAAYVLHPTVVMVHKMHPTCLRWKEDKVMTALGILFVVLCIVGIAGIIYVLASKDHFKDKEA